MKGLGAILAIIKVTKDLLNKKDIFPESYSTVELLCPFGFDEFEDAGIVVFHVNEREVCKKLWVLLGGQTYPRHRHITREEKFRVLYGELNIKTGDEQRKLQEGDTMSVGKGEEHELSTVYGAVMEEIATEQSLEDLYYSDETIEDSEERRMDITDCF